MKKIVVGCLILSFTSVRSYIPDADLKDLLKK